MLDDKYRNEMANWDYGPVKTIEAMSIQELLTEFANQHQSAARARDLGKLQSYRESLKIAAKFGDEIQARASR